MQVARNKAATLLFSISLRLDWGVHFKDREPPETVACRRWLPGYCRWAGLPFAGHCILAAPTGAELRGLGGLLRREQAAIIASNEGFSVDESDRRRIMPGPAQRRLRRWARTSDPACALSCTQPGTCLVFTALTKHEQPLAVKANPEMSVRVWNLLLSPTV